MTRRMDGLQPQMTNDEHVAVLQAKVCERRWAVAVHDHGHVQLLGELARG